MSALAYTCVLTATLIKRYRENRADGNVALPVGHATGVFDKPGVAAQCQARLQRRQCRIDLGGGGGHREPGGADRRMLLDAVEYGAEARRQVRRQVRWHQRARRVADHPAKRRAGGRQPPGRRLAIGDAASVAGFGLRDIGLGKLAEAKAALHAIERCQQAALVGQRQLEGALLLEHVGEGLDGDQKHRLLDLLEPRPLGPDQLFRPLDPGPGLAAGEQWLLDAERIAQGAHALRAPVGLGAAEADTRAGRGPRSAGRPGDRQAFVDRAQPGARRLEGRVLRVDLGERHRQGDLPGSRARDAERQPEEQEEQARGNPAAHGSGPSTN